MSRLNKKIVIKKNSRNGSLYVRVYKNNALVDEEVINDPEITEMTLDEVAEQLNVESVDIVQDPVTGEESLELNEGVEVIDDLVNNCGTKRNSRFRRNSRGNGKVVVKRMSRSRFLVKNADGTEDVVVEPDASDLTIDEVAESLPVTKADIVEDEDGNEAIEINVSDIVNNDNDDVKENSRFRRNSYQPRRVRTIRNRR